MAATKRKRSSGRRSYRRGYKRPSGVSVSGVVRALAKANQSMGPFGPGTANYERYGPSKRQMLEIKGAMLTPAQKQNRIMDKYYGDGDYWSDLGSNIYKNVVTPIGHWGSRALGGISGGMAGAEAGIPGILGGAAGGWNAGAEFSKAMGWGDYSVGRIQNQIAGGNGTSPIMMNPGEDLSGDVVIYNREFIGNITSGSIQVGGASTVFKNQVFTLNPADKDTFPYLSELAANFELFEWQGLGFQYIPTYGEGGNSNALGKLIMATNYDPESVPFDNAIRMQNYDYSTSSKPSLGMFHGVETAPDKRSVRQMYVRDSIVRDKMFTDLGKFEIASEGVPTANLVLGELWVTYRVKFSRNKLRDVVASMDTYDVFNYARAATVTAVKDLSGNGALINHLLDEPSGSFNYEIPTSRSAQASAFVKHIKLIDMGTNNYLEITFKQGTFKTNDCVMFHLRIRLTAAGDLSGSVVSGCFGSTGTILARISPAHSSTGDSVCGLKSAESSGSEVGGDFMTCFRAGTITDTEPVARLRIDSTVQLPVATVNSVIQLRMFRLPADCGLGVTSTSSLW